MRLVTWLLLFLVVVGFRTTTVAFVGAWPRALWGAAAQPQPYDSSTTKTSASHKDESDTLSSFLCEEEEDPRTVLQQFFQAQQQEQQGTASDKQKHRPFKIQGWRWHTMSLIREAGRVATALQQQPHHPDALATAVEYVVNFNLRGLTKIQATLFFPWVRLEMAQRLGDSPVATALNAVLDELEMAGQHAVQLGQALVSVNLV